MATATASNLRTQAVVVRWVGPVVCGGVALVAGAQSSPPAAFVAACFGAGLGWLAGFWTAAWFDAAAEALECGLAVLDSVKVTASVANQLSSQIASQHARMLEALRMIGESMVNADTRNTELLRILAENTDALTRLETSEQPANVNRG
jgi:hypothetical protein